MGTQGHGGFIEEGAEVDPRYQKKKKKKAWKKAGRRFTSREDQVKEVGFWGVMMNSEE